VSRSTDGGKTWDEIGANLPESCGFSNAPLVIDSETYLLGCVTKIVRSDDGGVSWEIVSSAGGFGPPLVASDGSIYWRIDANFGLMRSEDQGKTWVRTTGPGAVRGPVLELPDQRLASMNETHVVISADSGQSWVEVGPPFGMAPGGVTYSNQERAFFIFAGSSNPTIPAKSILRYDWDYEAE
jgi:photosystem II stability/assembly factor-like uncharacterized protein